MSGSYRFLIWLAIMLVAAAIAYYSSRNTSKREEEKRMSEILAHKSQWGEEMCQWLIENRIHPNDPRIVKIMENLDV